MKEEGNWVDALPTITKESKTRKQSSTNLSSIESFFKKKTRRIHFLEYNKQKIKPNFKKGDTVRTTDIKKMFRKTDTTNWIYKSYEVSKIIKYAIQSY